MQRIHWLLLSVVALAAAVLITPTLQADDNADLQAKAKAWAEKNWAPFASSLAVLKDELVKANKDRADWKPYSEDYKSWTPEDAEKNKPGYTYCEYLWSVKKDKAFRKQHLETPAAKALKEFEDKSGGVIGEIFVTDAKGGNVAQTEVTSDFFQGDEAKFQKAVEAKGIFADKPKRDDSTGEVGVHVSVPLYVKDGDKDVLIGVAIALILPDKIK